MHKHIKLLMLIICVSVLVSGQDTIQKRPTVGLVLSGGAAKGISQIGVIKVLESEGVYPDLITGCSMGGIIGGLYAIGYSTDEMDSLFQTVDWTNFFSDEMLLNRVSINEKQDYYNNMLHLQFDWNHKPSFPLALIQGQNITEKLGEVTWHASGIDNFDSLCIPYRATAADLVSSRVYYFSGGDIKTAIRSTMAIPSIFGPVILDTMMLVDGGILVNFPVAEARRLGADYIIGVYTSYNEQIEREDIYSLVRILARSSFVTGVCDARVQMEDVDLLIRPDMAKHGPESFQKMVDIVNIGERAALAKLDTIKKLGRYLKQFPEPERRKIPQIDSFYITHIGAEGNVRIKESYITAWSGLTAGRYVGYPDVRDAVRDIYSTLHFDNVDYFLKKTEKGFALIFRVIEKRAGQLGIGVHYDNDFKTGIVAEALYRNLLLSADRIYAGVNISQNSQMRADYTIYLGKRKRNFGSLRFYAENTDLPHYFSIDTLSSGNGKIRQGMWDAEVKLGTMLSHNSAISIEGIYEWFEYKFSEGLDDHYGIKKINFKNFRARGAFELNTMDRAYFPEKGVKAEARADYVFTAPDNYLKIYGSYDHLIRLQKLFSMGLEARVGMISGTPLLYDQFYLGGDHFVPRKNMVNSMGRDVYSLNVKDFISFGMSVQFNIKSQLYICVKGNIISCQSLIDGNGDTSNDSYGYGASLGYRSPVGPIKISLYKNSLETAIGWLFNFSYPF